MSSFEKTIDTKIINLEKPGQGKLVMMEEKVNNQRPEPVLEGIDRIEAPCFNGNSPLFVFKFQFESASNKNGSDDGEKALELVLSLRETMSASCSNDYSELMVALQRKFGGKHKRELHPMDLSCRAEKANESFLDFAMEVDG